MAHGQQGGLRSAGRILLCACLASTGCMSGPHAHNLLQPSGPGSAGPATPTMLSNAQSPATPPTTRTPAVDSAIQRTSYNPNTTTTVPAPAPGNDPNSYTIQSLDVLYWSLSAAHRLPDGLIGGKNIVGGDGNIALGKYGTLNVAGMTAEQARQAIALHLQRRANTGQVNLTLTVYAQSMAADTHSPYAHTATTAAKPTPAAEKSASPVEAPSHAQLAQAPTEGASPYRVCNPYAAKSADQEWHPVGTEKPAAHRTPVVMQTAAVTTTPATEQPAHHDDTYGATLRSANWQAAAHQQDATTAQHTTEAPTTTTETPPSDPAVTKSNHSGYSFGLGSPTKMLAMADPIGESFPHESAPHELAKVSLPPYIIEPPDVLLIESVKTAPDQPIIGQHLVRPDGTVGLGVYGSVYVAGLTLDMAKQAIEAHLSSRIKNPQVSVDVLAYNSKVYYVITDGGGYGEQVTRFPITGNETVLDAISQINGLPPVASKKHIWIARRSPAPNCAEQILPVDWCAITQHGLTLTNYQILPGDRVYVKADKWRTLDAAVAKVLSPFERVFGFTLLGASTVSAVKNASHGFNGNNSNSNGSGLGNGITGQ